VECPEYSLRTQQKEPAVSLSEWEEVRHVNIHGLLDKLAIGLGSLFVPKFMRDGVDSQSIEYYLSKLQIPDFSLKRQVTDNTVDVPVLLDDREYIGGYKIGRLAGPDHPLIIYHHGMGETPYDYGFDRIFRANEQTNSRCNLIAVRGLFHRSNAEVRKNTNTLTNWVMMLASSVLLIERIVNKASEITGGDILISGASLGGFMTNLHHIHYNTASIYAPLLAGAAMDAVLLDSIYSTGMASLSKEEEKTVRQMLNFERDFRKSDRNNVYPLLARQDEIVQYDRQVKAYEGMSIKTIEKGHTTGALAFTELREHILTLID